MNSLACPGCETLFDLSRYEKGALCEHGVMHDTGPGIDPEKDTTFFCEYCGTMSILQKGHNTLRVIKDADIKSMNRQDRHYVGAMLLIFSTLDAALMTETHHAAMIKRATQLVPLDPPVTTHEGMHLHILSSLIDRYERKKWPAFFQDHE